MGKALQNKIRKRAALLESAYELFATNGFSKTTIREIADHAGVAKGTFYLYFTDKADIRDTLVTRMAARLLERACASMEEYVSSSTEEVSTADKFVYITDYILQYVSTDPFFVKYVSKHMSWGLLGEGQKKEQAYSPLDPENAASIGFVTYIRNMLDADGVKIRDLKVLLFTLLGMISAFTYDLVIYQEPMPLDDFKPHMHRMIRHLVNEAIIEE